MRRLAGELAILGAALLVAGLLPDYRGSNSLLEEAGYRSSAEWYVWHTLTLVVLLLVGAAGIFVARTSRLIGPGLLLGAAAASSLSLTNLIGDPTGSPDAGYWLELSAHLVIVLAACLTVIALVADPDVRLARAPGGVLAWWVLAFGAVGALTLVFHTLRVFHNVTDEKYQILSANIAATVMALVVPVCAALAVPHRFGVFLLAGWITAGATFSLVNFTFLEYHSLDTGTVIVFGSTLIGLAVIASYLDRAEPRRIFPPASASSL
jgi:hypothetical protein